MSIATVGNRNGSQPTDEVQICFNRIIESEVFRTAHVTRTLLLYLWQHQGSPINEYAVAVDALARAPDFDPKSDATVRVQIARLRAKLKEFYDAEGKTLPLHLSIPLGTHQLQWEYAPPTTFSVSPRALAASHPTLLLAVTLGSLILAAVCLVLLGHAHGQQVHFASPKPSAKLWQPMLANGKPTYIVVPDSTALQFGGITVIDPSVHRFEEWSKSAALMDLSKKFGPPSLNQVYTVARHSLAGFRLLRYLEDAGNDSRLVESADFGGDALAQQNTIFVGGSSTAAQAGGLLPKTSFVLDRTPFPSRVRNRNPAAGEQAEYREVMISQERKICPGIVIWLPARSQGTRTLLFLGRWTSALVSLVTTPEGQKLLGEELAKVGSPDGWEAVIQAEVQADTTVLRVWPVAVRPIPATYWN